MASERRIPMEECEHNWEESVSSQWSNDVVCEVYCDKCHTYGEKTYATGKIYWPCT